jgi:flagellar motor switch protein FliM
MIDKLLANMFESKRSAKENLTNYIGARVTDAEEVWLRAEMKKRKLSMSDLIRLALGQLTGKA